METKSFKRGPLTGFAAAEQWWYVAEVEIGLALGKGRGVFAKLEYILELWRLGVGLNIESDWFLAALEVYVGPFTFSLGWWSNRYGDQHVKQIADWEEKR